MNLPLPAWLTRLWHAMSPFERKVVMGLVLLVLLSATVTVIRVFQGYTHLVPESGGMYTEAAVGQPRYLNPILAGANDVDVDITRLVFSGLFRLDANLHLQPDLAEKYELAADQKTYTVHLRSGVTWQDGSPFTADDVVFTISSIQTPDYASPLANEFQGVDVKKIDDHTVRFTLKQPYAPFLQSLTVGIVSHRLWDKIDPKNAALAEQMLKPVGTGPFQFKEFVSHRRTGEISTLRLQRNPTYYGQRPYLDEIDFTFYPSHDEAVTALGNGTVDGLSFLPVANVPKIKAQSRFVVHHILLPQYFALFFNQEKNTILRDAGVRNALDLALDRAAIIKDALSGQGEPLQLPIPPGVFAHNEQLDQISFNIEAAKQNLEDSGWKVGADGIRSKNKQRLELTITTTDFPEYAKTAQLIQQQWRTIGVDTKLNSLGAGTIQQTAIRPRDFDVLLFGEILAAQPDPYPFWHSSQAKSPGLNFSQFSNKDVDKLLEQARQTIDDQKREQLYNDFQGKILELKPALILYRPYYVFVSTQRVRGMAARYADLPAGRFNDIWNWHVRVRRVWGSK